MQKSFLLLTLLALITHRLAMCSDDAADVLSPNKPAHYYVAAHFATGPWAESRKEFICPVLGEVTETKIAIYVKKANEEAIKLAVALDHEMQRYPQLKQSFLLVSEEDRSVSMTDDELAQNLEMLRELGKKNGLTKLSLGFVQYSTELTRWRNKLGFFNDSDVVIAVVEPGIFHSSQKQIRDRLPTRTVKPFYRYVTRLNSSDMTEATAVAEISKAISSLSQ